MLKRRSFLAALAALPLVGRLFAEEREPKVNDPQFFQPKESTLYLSRIHYDSETGQITYHYRRVLHDSGDGFIVVSPEEPA